MKCHHCGKSVDSVVVNHISALPGNFPKTIKCVAYCCPNESCAGILGVESDPDLRDSTMHKIKKDLADISKMMAEEGRRAQMRRATKLGKFGQSASSETKN
jgi:hypothetical protein